MKWNAGKQFEKAPPGSHIARCYLVVDLGTQPKSFQGVVHMERQVKISFELPEEKMEGIYDPNQKGKPFSVTQNFKQSLHLKSNLRKTLSGWRGRDFKDAAEIESFDPKKLPGLPCRINLVENGEYINIASVAPLGKKEKCPKQVNASVYLSLEEDEFDGETFDALHESLRNKIAASPEYKKLTGDGNGEESQPDAPADEAPPADDDDTPF